MNKFLFIIVFFVFSSSIFSQNKQKMYFSSLSLENAILKIEKKFSLKYSYLDSVVVNKTISLTKKEYSIEEINFEIEKQTQLKTKKISDRFYTIYIEKKEQTILFLDEILIDSFLMKGIQKSNQKFVLIPKTEEILAGVTDTDVMLTLQKLPGVKSPYETATGLHVKGGTPDQNLILLDGIRLFHPGHLFGMISGINPNIVKKINFINKGTSPKFGERVSSVIEIETPDNLNSKIKGTFGINTLNTDGFIQIPIIKEKLDIQLSGRKSFTEFLQSKTFSQLTKKVFQNTDFKTFDDKNNFQFYDYSNKIIYKPTKKSSFSFTNLSINNNLNYNFNIGKDTVSNQKMRIRNDGYSINWNKKYSKIFSHKILIYYSNYNFNYLKKQDYNLSQKFEAFKKINRIINSGAELNFSSVISKNKLLEYGYQIAGNDVSHLFNSYNQNLSIDLSLKRFYEISHSGYFNFTFKNNKLNFQSGVRNSYFSKIKVFAFEPRFFLQNKLSDAFILQFSYERKNQILAQVRENVANDLSLENYVWVLADNEKYPIQKANQFSAGIIYTLQNWTFDFDAYYKNIEGITSFNFEFFNQQNELAKKGKGYTKGFDIFIQKKSEDWQASLTYSFINAKNKFENFNNNNYFNSNANSVHSVNLLTNKSWKNFSSALGWCWNSGKPYSTITTTGESNGFNNNNLTSYHRIDFSLNYNFFHHKINYKTGFSIYNLLNQKNILSREYERKYASFSDFSNPRFVSQDYYSLGFTPNIFFRVSF